MTLSVLVAGHNFVNPVNRARLAELARLPDLSVTALVPHRWTGSHGEDYDLTRGADAPGYRLIAHRVLFRGVNRQHRYLYAPGLRGILESVAPDLVHIEEEAYSPVTFQLARAVVARGVPFVITAFQNISKRFPIPFRWMERWVLARASGAFCSSPDILAVLRQKGFAGPDAPNALGVDPDVYCPGREEALAAELAPEGLAVGYVGRLDAVKGVEYLVTAAAGLPGVRLVLIGSGKEAPRLRARVAELGLASRVTWRATVPHCEVPRYLRALDVIVMPSVTLPTVKEQFGRVAVEAMACGVPVIGTTSGSLPGVIGDAGIVVPERDSEALKDALAALAADPARRRALGEAGRARVLERFTLAAIVRRAAAFYHEVVGR